MDSLEPLKEALLDSPSKIPKEPLSRWDLWITYPGHNSFILTSPQPRSEIQQSYPFLSDAELHLWIYPEGHPEDRFLVERFGDLFGLKTGCQEMIYTHDLSLDDDYLERQSFRITLATRLNCGYAPEKCHLCQEHASSDSSEAECRVSGTFEWLEVSLIEKQIQRKDNFPEAIGQPSIDDFKPEEQDILLQNRTLTTLYYEPRLRFPSLVQVEWDPTEQQYWMRAILPHAEIKNEITGEQATPQELEKLAQIARQITQNQWIIESETWPGGNTSFWLIKEPYYDPQSGNSYLEWYHAKYDEHKRNPEYFLRLWWSGNKEVWGRIWE